MRCCLYSFGGLQRLLATRRGSFSFSSVESFESFFQEYPRYFEGIPLGHEEFVFDISFDAAHNVAKS
jgi:hypothetical protein